MKVITIKQPYASLIVSGLKEYEFRSWKTKYRGDIYIHAGLGFDKEAMKRFEHLNLDYPKGCIIAKVTIDDCIIINDDLKNRLIKKDPLVYHGLINDSRKIYGFKIKNIKKIDPIYIKGQLGLWNYHND